jgi:hypothetical protein
MRSRFEQIYRDGWPKASAEWSVELVEEMGLEWGFWTYKRLQTRREKLAVVLLCMRLKLRHNFSITEIANLFGKARTGIHPYMIRGNALLTVDPTLCRTVTMLDGRMAPTFLIATFPDLWETLFDENEPDQLAPMVGVN